MTARCSEADSPVELPSEVSVEARKRHPKSFRSWPFVFLPPGCVVVPYLQRKGGRMHNSRRVVLLILIVAAAIGSYWIYKRRSYRFVAHDRGKGASCAEANYDFRSSYYCD